MELKSGPAGPIRDYSCKKPQCYWCQMMAYVPEKQPVVMKPIYATDPDYRFVLWTEDEDKLLLNNINIGTRYLVPFFTRHTKPAISNRKYILRKLHNIPARGRWAPQVSNQVKVY